MEMKKVLSNQHLKKRKKNQTTLYKFIIILIIFANVKFRFDMNFEKAQIIINFLITNFLQAFCLKIKERKY